MDKLIPVEYKSQRIVTTKFLAEQYGTDENNIIKNFNSNKSRFIEGKHYFKLEGAELKDFKANLPSEIKQSLKFISKLILWTFDGAIVHLNIMNIYKTGIVKMLQIYFNQHEKVIVVDAVRKETEFIKNLRIILQNICEMQTQYIVGQYRIDAYIEKYNLAIEYDEKAHKYSSKNDSKRELYIKSKLGCTFIRVNEREEAIGINKILKFLLSKGAIAC